MEFSCRAGSRGITDPPKILGSEAAKPVEMSNMCTHRLICSQNTIIPFDLIRDPLQIKTDSKVGNR